MGLGGSGGATQLYVMRPVPTSGRLEGMDGLTAIWAKNLGHWDGCRMLRLSALPSEPSSREPKRRERFVGPDVHGGAPSLQYLRR